MERQNRLLTILSVILLVVIAVIAIDNNQNGGKKQSKDFDGPKTGELVDYKPDEVVKLSVQDGEGPEAQFEKTGSSWTMVAPKKVAIDERKVSEIVDRFDSVKVEERALTGDPAGYGLDPAGRAHLTFGTADGRSWQVWVGKETTVGYGTYVQTEDGGPVGVAQTHLKDLAHRGVDDFRTKEIWKVSSGTAKRVEITGPAGEHVVLRKNDHGWWLGEDGPRVDESTVSDWLKEAGLLRAESFVDDGPADLTARATLIVEDADGTHTLTIGETAGETVTVKGDGPLANVGLEVNDLLRFDGWAGTSLLPVRKFQVDGISVKLGDFTASFSKSEGLWKDAGGAVTALAEGLMEQILLVHADRTTVPAGASSGWGSITLTESAGGTPHNESITLGDAVEGGRIAKDGSGGPAFLLPQADLDVLIGVARGTLPAPTPKKAPGGMPSGLEGFEGFEGLEGFGG